MNHCSYVGRLTRDPELSKTASGKDMGRFRLAINRTKEDADFVPCVAWNQSAEYLSKYAHKGDTIGVTGFMKSGEYTGQDGSKRFTLECWADRVEIYHNNKPKADYPNNGVSKTADDIYRESQSEDVKPDDLPF